MMQEKKHISAMRIKQKNSSTHLKVEEFFVILHSIIQTYF